MKNIAIFSPKTNLSIDTFKVNEVERPELVKGGTGNGNTTGGMMEVVDAIDY